MKCPRCQSERISKNGRKKGKQRFLCKDCNRQFVAYRSAQGYPDDFKQICLKDYLNGKSFRSIERARGVHHTTVILWAKQAGLVTENSGSAESTAPDSSAGTRPTTEPIKRTKTPLVQKRVKSYLLSAPSHLDRQLDRQSSDSSDERSEKSAAILRGALEVFAAQGYTAASMSKIASASGVSKPTLYSYFQDKEGLFAALIEQILGTARHAIASLTINHDPQSSPEDVLRQIASTVLTKFASNQPLLLLMRLLIGESGRFPELARTFVRKIESPIFEQLSAYLKFHPKVQTKDSMVMARIFVGALVHYLIIQHVLHGEDIVSLAGDRMIDGLIARMMAAEI